jgi:hypothetical protein
LDAYYNRLFNSKEDSDITIVVGNTKFSAHKVILRLQTPFFSKATRGTFAESKDNTVIIEENSGHSVWRFLRFCYTADYSESSTFLVIDEGELFDLSNSSS